MGSSATLPGLRRPGFGAGAGQGWLRLGQPGCWVALRDGVVAAAQDHCPQEKGPLCAFAGAMPSPPCLPRSLPHPPTPCAPASEQCLRLSSDFPESYCERLQCLIPWGCRDLRESWGKSFVFPPKCHLQLFMPKLTDCV